MADFFQNGSVATLHHLGDRPLQDLELELTTWSDGSPMALVIPTLYSELDGPALSAIVDQVAQIPYLSQVIIGLDAAGPEDFAHAREFFDRLSVPTRILWNDGPGLSAIDAELARHDLAPPAPGKGRNVWYCLGYFLAAGRAEVLALHDADILTYSREIPARLFYPLVHPGFEYAFSKGYYARVGDGRLNGRASRLLVTPLLRALRSTLGPSPYLDYLDSFRYPLAGEMAMRDDVVRAIRIPSDWGLEIGILSEVYRQYSTQRVCQVDLAHHYDHKHQPLSPDDPGAGLHKMSIDISKAIYRKLAVQGAVLSTEVFRTLKAAYYRSALDLVDWYHHDAVLNGLEQDRHAEEQVVEMFSGALMTAGEQFLSSPMETPFMPSWSRVVSAVPDVLDRLAAAVEADNTSL